MSEQPTRKRKPQPVRFSPEQNEGLMRLAEQFGVSQANLVRWAVEAMLRKVGADGGKMTLPFKLDDIEDRQMSVAETEEVRRVEKDLSGNAVTYPPKKRPRQPRAPRSPDK